MNSNEKKLWHYVAKSMKHRGHFCRVESPATSPGIPDVDYCIDGFEGHLELKYAHDEKDGLTMRPTQYSWFERRVEAGGYPMILAWVADTKEYFLMDGKAILTLKGDSNVGKWRSNAGCTWNGFIPWNEFETVLVHPWRIRNQRESGEGQIVVNS